MTQISRDDAVRLAQLCGLQLDEKELSILQQDLTAILTYVRQLDELPTDKVTATYQVTGLENVWRSDEIEEESVRRKELLALAPEADEEYIKVPKVL